MNFRYIKTLVAAVAITGVSALLPFGVANAESELLDSTKLLYKGQKVDVNLYGEKLDSGYAYDLLLVLKREDGSVVTGYRPTVKGGYGFYLTPAQFKDKEGENEQLVLMAKQGDWRVYSEYRVLDFADAKKVKELFSAVDSFGVVVQGSLADNNLELMTVRDKEPIAIKLNEKLLEDVPENRRRFKFGKLFSLSVFDVDGDGKHELITDQQLTVDKKILADVGAVWCYTGPKDEKKEESAGSKEKEIKAKGKSVADVLEAAQLLMSELEKELDGDKEKDDCAKLWRQVNMTVMKNNVTDKRNTINNGAFFQGGMIYPVKMIAPNGEATYPMVSFGNGYELQSAWNKVLLQEADGYISKYFKGQADMAYNVLRADDKLVSIQLISGKDKFVHHNVNFVPGKKEKLELADLLKVKDKQLIPLLNLLNKNSKLTFDKNLTDEWYIIGEKLFLVKNIDGIDEVAVFELADLHKFVKLPGFVIAPKEEK